VLNVFHNFVLAACLVIDMPFFYTQTSIMYIANITFIAGASDFRALLDDVRSVAVKALTSTGVAVEPRIMHLREAGGESCENAETVSIALQLHINTESELNSWREQTLIPFLASWQRRYGESRLAFHSLLQHLPL
jgi:hypothetical protein